MEDQEDWAVLKDVQSGTGSEHYVACFVPPKVLRSGTWSERRTDGMSLQYTGKPLVHYQYHQKIVLNRIKAYQLDSISLQIKVSIKHYINRYLVFCAWPTLWRH